jgi:hypothetical protein
MFITLVSAHRYSPPQSIKPRNTYFLKWHDKACLGVTKELDLNNDRLMDAVWKTKEPTGILFTTRGNDEDVRRIQVICMDKYAQAERQRAFSQLENVGSKKEPQTDTQLCLNYSSY